MKTRFMGSLLNGLAPLSLALLNASRAMSILGLAKQNAVVRLERLGVASS